MTRPQRACTLLVLACLATAPSHSAAQSPEVLLRAARHAEARADPKAAAELYEQLVQLAPSSRLGRRAGRRLSWLRARSENDFVTLAAVERMRRRSGDLNASSVRELLDALESAPPGLARREGLALAGESYLALQVPENAGRAFEQLGRSADASAEERRHATTGRARALLQMNSPGAALRLLEDAGLGRTALGEHVARARRTQIGRRVCFVWLGLFVLLTLALTRGRLLSLDIWRRTLSRRRLLAGLYVVGAPLLIASLFDGAAFDTFAWLGLGSALVLLLTSATNRGLSPGSRKRRLLLAAGAVVSELCVAYVVLAELGEVLSFGA
jgi:tetratricopeptide (TPR) repeat protein